MSGACNFAQVFKAEQIEIAAQCAARKVPDDLQFDAKPGPFVPDRLGIAFSGGGVRSACIAIGILQRLAHAQILKHVHYVSAISGGSYAMSWLTAWTARAGEFSAVEGCLSNNTADGKPPTPATLPDYRRFLEPEPLHYLRRYSSYLTPRMGLFSGDTLAAISIYLRNVLLNQLMLIATLISITLVLQRIAPQIGWVHPLHNNLLILGVAAASMLFVIAAMLVWRALSKLPESRSPASKRPAYAALGCVVGTACLVWLMTPSWYVHYPTEAPTLWIVGILGALGFLVSVILGTLAKSPTSVERGTAMRILVAFLAWAGAGGAVCLVDKAFRAWLIHDKLVIVNDAYVILALPAILVSVALVSYLFVGLLGNGFPDSQREWLARLSGYLFSYAFAAGALLALVLEGPVVVQLLLNGLLEPAWKNKILSALLPGGWFFVVLTGLLGGNSQKTSGTDTKPSSRTLDLIVTFAPPIFLAGLLMVVAWATHALVLLAMDATPADQFLTSASWAHPAAPHLPLIAWRFLHSTYPIKGSIGTAAPELRYELRKHAFRVLWFASTLLALILAWRLDVNEFSMHLFYRNRLVRAFVGASNLHRTPSLFTGFASNDDIALQDLTAAKSFQGPYPLWGTTLNLTSGEDLAWQQRKGACFLYSPLYCGWDYVDTSIKSAQPESPATDEDKLAKERPTPANIYGYRPTSPQDGEPGYGGLGGAPYIGTAMAASGAAASPNMGFHTRPGVAALLALFNVRLGWWTGNPRNPRFWKSYAPGIGYLFSEFLGRANAADHYVYLSDGGHFENLGLYELIRRKVRFIICSDAAADLSFAFGDLGNAVERCRADFGVEIRIEAQLEMKLQDDPPFRTAHYAIGSIHYPGQDAPGLLLYLKSSLTNDEPSDVLGMRAADSSFPHDTTANQFFDESMFEAYRALGAHMIDKLIETNPPDPSAPNKAVGLFKTLHAKTA